MAGYNDAIQAIKNYYAGTAYDDIWYKICQNKTLTSAEIEAIKKVPFVTTVVNNDGSIASWTYEMDFKAAENYAGTINSNAQTPAYSSAGTTKTRVNATATQTAGKTTLTSGSKKIVTGTRVSTVASKVFAATTMVAAGAWLGKTIDSALYSLNPSWWDEHAPTINPQTWDSIATTEGGKNFINTLFGIEDDDSAQMYIPEEALAMAYLTLLNNGAYSSGGTTSTYTRQGVTYNLNISGISAANLLYFPNTVFSMPGGYIILYQSGGDVEWYGISTTYNAQLSTNAPYSWSIRATKTATTYGGRTFYYTGLASRTGTVLSGCTLNTGILSDVNLVASIILDGDTHQVTPLDGVSDDPNATGVDPSLITATDPAGVLEQMKTNYPDLFTGSVQDDVLQDDGTVKSRKYVPVPFTANQEQPVTGTNKQSNPKVNPSTSSEQDLQDAVDDLTISIPAGEMPTVPDTGTGSSPTITPVEGSASSLWAVYNPTQGELDSFGAWLWSSNFVDQIKKLFSDPMQAIIGVHKVFAAPSTGTAQNIKVGYLDSGVSAAVVTDQYTTVDCGTVNVREYFGNVFDYSPYMEISLFLPFVGIVKLDPADVMRGKVSVKYTVDVITGACLAEVRVERDTYNPVLYTYAGSAIVTYPVSAGSYVGAVTGALSIAAGVAGTILSGGALAPALMGGALGATHLHANVQHSGSFSGSAGAMGGKKPYIIISRPQGALPAKMEEIQGVPASKSIKLGSCDGFTRVRDVDLEGITATTEELRMIESELKAGVYL